MSRKRLFLIDGYSNIFRAFYAIRGLSNSKGFATNAVYGFLNMLRKLLREQEPEYLGIAFDVSDETVLRKEKYADYKANRKPMPEDLKPQIPWIRKAIEAHRIPVLELNRYEADDVLGTLAKKAAAAGYDVVLVSADKDLMQLVDEHVRLFHTGREKLYDPELVETDFGVPPDKVIDVLALKGDSVDNVPGVPGIGEKGARGLIKEYGDLETLLERAGEVKRKSYREGLTEHRDKAELSKELVTIHTDLPVEFEPERLALEAPDAEALKKIYRELEFFSLLKELETDTAQAVETEPAVEALTAAEWKKGVSALAAPYFVGVVGGSPEEGGEAPLGAVVAGESGPALYGDFRRDGLEKAALSTLDAWLGDGARELHGHDLKEVLRLVRQKQTPQKKARQKKVSAPLFDTMLASYLLHSAARSHTLETIAFERLGIQTVAASEAGWDKGQVPPLGHEPLLLYAAERVEIPRRLAESLQKDLEADELGAVYRDIEAPLVAVLVAMEEKGIVLDVDFLNGLSKQLAEELATIEEEIYKIAGDRFNIQSPRQLGEVMFDRLGYPVIKKTRKTKSYSTDSATLEELATRGYELPEKILAYRELAKLKSTYVDAFPELVAGDGRLHTRFHQAVAATGRLSSASPNLQNIPVRTERGQEIRKAFVAPRGARLLVADYNQIELRVLAHIAEEPELIEAFQAGKDIHASTAAAVLGVAEELVTGEQRRAAKVINFGIMYGMSAFGLAQNLKIPKAEAESFIDAYLSRYAGVKRYMDETVELATRKGKVETLYGRVRWLPDIKSRNYNLRENAKRMAINARIQGTAADLLKMAMIAVDRRLRAEHPDAALLLTVHDELVIECPTGQVEAVGGLVREEMVGVEQLAVPLVVDLGSGKSWYEAKS